MVALMQSSHRIFVKKVLSKVLEWILIFKIWIKTFVDSKFFYFKKFIFYILNKIGEKTINQTSSFVPGQFNIKHYIENIPFLIGK